MKNKLLVSCLVIVLAVSLVGSTSFVQAPTTEDLIRTIQSLPQFQEKFDAHYRVPNDESIERMLTELRIALPGAERQQMQALVQEYRAQFVQRNPTTPNPRKWEALLNKERGAAAPMSMSAEAATPQIMSLAVPVEFPATDTFDWCGTPVTTVGPLHNEIGPPGPRDNNTIWYEDATPALYNELYFGVGKNAGVIVNHPNLGKVDLRGNTMANYYLEQSEGKFVPKGEVYPKWLQALHSEGWYGQDNCTGSNHNILAGDLVREVIDAVNADDPAFPWQNFDGDGDGVVDNFTVLHAGMGQEAGGGVQGDFSIWSHASAIDFPSGKLACMAGSAGCPDRDIFVREYSMDPENIDIGVISEEFGHAAFGLPDIYTTDYQASVSNWAIMEAGSWNGILGGMQPAPFPLFFRTLIGWADPVELDYSTGLTSVRVGQLSLRPKGTEQGIKINLPDNVVETANLAGTGQGWWSDKADLADFYLAHDFDLTGTTAPVFSFSSFWSFEEDYDYGYFEVSEDAGATWTALPDLGGIFVDDGSGTPGLNGEDQGILSFDLSAYAGKVITLRLHYTSDVGVQWAGWWADDFALVDGATTLFSDDVEAGEDGWMTNNFVLVPLTRTFPMYYLAEWRNNSGFDRGLKYPYQTVYSDDDEWEVDRCAHTVPGMLLWLRNSARDFDYTLSDSYYDPPSLGPKHALLVIDSHYWPMSWSNYTYAASGANVRITSRCQPANATFTVQKTTPFTLRLGYDPATGIYQDTPLETKTFERLPAVSQFHDSLGYYPGLWYNPNDDGLYFWQSEASAVVPATTGYTTRITWPDGTPLTELYGLDLGGGLVLGSGDPRDNNGQYGLNIAVLNKADNGSWGKIAVWNATTLVDLNMKANQTRVVPGQLIRYQLIVRNISPARQTFTVTDLIPDNTTFWRGKRYDAATNSIVWTASLSPKESRVLEFWVKVNKNVPAGTQIINSATLVDDTLGSSASVTILVKRK